jgi:epoxide hydrolase
MVDVVVPFVLTVAEADLDDLQGRLRATRWPEAETDPSQGFALGEIQALCAYWAEDYDWRVLESRLNDIGQYITTIDGLLVHFLHARSADPDAVPLLLTHGWPGSVIEYLEVIEPLTVAGFHCVVPSLPGYGWSGKPTQPGWGVTRIAQAWATLMERLGYRRYVAQGGDWGTSVTAGLGQRDVQHVIGIHVMPPLAPMATSSRRQPDKDAGYSMQHRTRPQTIGYALTDSPAALAAWLGEKLTSWTDPREPLSRTQIVDNLMAYWLPATGASSARLYWESLRDVDRWLHGPLEPRDLVHAPTGCTVFPYELQRPGRTEAARRFSDIRYWSEPERGGHFAAWEQPMLFVSEIRAFIGSL